MCSLYFVLPLNGKQKLVQFIISLFMIYNIMETQTFNVHSQKNISSMRPYLLTATAVTWEMYYVMIPLSE